MSNPEDRNTTNETQDRQGQNTACGPGCNCGTSGSGGLGRLIAGIVVLLVAGVLVVRAVVKDNGTVAASTTSARFAALPASETSTEETTAAGPAAVDTITEITTLSDLNATAEDTVGVFIFLPGGSDTDTVAPTAQMRGAAKTIEPQLRGGRIGIFALKAGSRDYQQVTSRMAVPGVLAMVKGGGMVPVSGDITEMKLIQAFAAASSASGCGPSSGGCGPGGCN